MTNAADRDSRTLLDDFKLDVVDQHGNRCELVEGGTHGVLCCYVDSDHDVAAGNNLPTLDNADREGRVMAQVIDGAFVFPLVTLDDCSQASSGRYRLVFRYTPAVELTQSPLQTSIRFDFVSREQYSNEILSIEQQLQQGFEKVEAHRLRREQLRELRDRRRNLAAGINVSDAIRSAILSNNIDELRDLHRGRLSQLDNLISRGRTPCRAAVRKIDEDRYQHIMSTVSHLGPGSRGWVVDLGYVNDVNEARILSFHAKRYMDAWVVDNTDMAQELYSRGVKAWALDMIRPFRMRTRDNRTR